MVNMDKYRRYIEELWEKRHQTHNARALEDIKDTIMYVISMLNSGKIRVADRVENEWRVIEWVKKSIILYFLFKQNKLMSNGVFSWYDKIEHKFDESTEESEFLKLNTRVVPGAYIRTGSYIGQNTVIMPSFINIGAYVDDYTMIDTWSTIGSCAQIGKNCHISGGVGIGGVLEPINANPIIIEDNCFIGARSQITEGVIVREGSVLGMGVFLSASTKIFNKQTKEITYGEIPSYSVVIPGSLKLKDCDDISVNCAVIIKQTDKSTRKKTAINDLLRS